MMKRLTILWKGLILIAVPLLFQLGFIGLLGGIRAKAGRAEFWTMHTKDVVILTESCRVHLLTAFGEVQGLVISRDPTFESHFRQAEGLTRRRLSELRIKVSDNPDQSRAAKLLEDEARRFLEFMAEGVALIRSGRMSAELAGQRRFKAQGLFDDLNRRFATFVAEEVRLQRDRDDNLKRTTDTLDGLLAGGTLFSVLFTVCIAVVFARNISRRITVLTDNAIRLAEGRELNPPIGGRDEIARLDDVFHKMADTLVKSAGRERRHVELLQDRADELASVNHLLHEKATENEMFVYSVSHDLRSPLVNLQGFSKELGLIGRDLDLLIDKDAVPPATRKRAKELIETEMAESIGFIQTAVTRLSAIIDALLRLSRAGRVEYRRTQVEVGPIIGRIVSALGGTIEERGATVTVGPLPSVYCDPTAVEQIFANLIGNAVNYLDPKRPGWIEVFAVESGGEGDGVIQAPINRTFAVADNGLGIAESYRDKVFAAFQRLHGDVAKGEGVGLALVRRVAERLGGKIWFESIVGEGTTFYLSLPSREPDPARPEKEAEDSRESSPNHPERDVTWQPSH